MSWAGSMAQSHAPTLTSALNQQGISSNLHPHAMQQNLGMANAAYNANQQAFQQQAAIARQYQQRYRPKEFRINGQDMHLNEFLDTLYPEDCAEKTYLALKLTKGNENDNT